MIKCMLDLGDQLQVSPDNLHTAEVGKVDYALAKWNATASFPTVPHISFFNLYFLFIYLIFCFFETGTAKFLKERTYDVSDSFRVHVCSNCGLFANANLENQEFSCSNCSHLDKVYPIYQVHIPYAAKTLI